MKKQNTNDGFAKVATDWIADQFTVTKNIKKRDKANTKAGKKAK